MVIINLLLVCVKKTSLVVKRKTLVWLGLILFIACLWQLLDSSVEYKLTLESTHLQAVTLACQVGYQVSL